MERSAQVLPRRLQGRQSYPVDGITVLRADTVVSRLVGLSWLRSTPPKTGLLLSGTRSVHTVGMLFPLDLVWLDRGSQIVRIDRAVRPLRVRMCRAAAQVLELMAGDTPLHWQPELQISTFT